MSLLAPQQTLICAAPMSAYGGKADMAFCGNPLSQSLLRVKRTSAVGLHMSASDPKRTSHRALPKSRFEWLRCPCKMGTRMRRREFIALLGGAAAWSVAARAQPADRVRRIGVLIGLAADDPQGRAIIAAFLQGLQQLGWSDGRNVKIDIRWGAGNAEDMRKYAAELVTLTPDVMLATGGTTVGPLLQASRTVPIVFANVPDPVGSGFVDSLAQPGGNATGFVQFEYSLSGKWLELLKADRTGRDASSGPLGSCHNRGHRPVRRHSGCSAVARD